MSNSEKHNNPDNNNRQLLQNREIDMLVVGGGITGAGIALEAARSGLKTVLVEQKDFAWGTSSRSSKMVHGGLRYIAQGDIRLTRESLHERERLVKELPGLVYRQFYLFPHRKKSFPGRFSFGLLLALYDFLAGISDRKFISRKDTLKRVPGLREKALKGASTYTDALTDDSRLVMRVLQEAVSHGAEIHNYMQVTSVQAKGDNLAVTLAPEDGEEFSLESRVVANATGAFADRLRPGDEKKVRPLRGSHIVFPRERLPVDDVLTILHREDNRPIFIYPWAGRTVAGTTDLDHKEDLMREPTITATEVKYLLDEVNRQFPKARITEEDVISTFSGVRPVVSSGSGVNPSAERRDHAVWDDKGLITVTGGKLTTFRVIAHDVMKKALPRLIKAGKHPKLHHGRLFGEKHRAENRKLAKGNTYLEYLAACYGDSFPSFCALNEDMTPIQGTPHCIAELAWALEHEQVRHLDDLLLRRTRLGLLLEQGASELKEDVAALCQKYVHWDEQKFEQEWQRYQKIWHDHYFLPEEKSTTG